MALEIVLTHGLADIGPLAALPPVVGESRFAQQLLEPRIGTRA